MVGDLQIFCNFQIIQSGDDGTSWACDSLVIVVAMESGGPTSSRNQVTHSQNFINRDLTTFLLDSGIRCAVHSLDFGAGGRRRHLSTTNPWTVACLYSGPPT